MASIPTSEDFVSDFLRLAGTLEVALAPAVLVIARLEYPSLTPARSLEQLDVMGAAAAARLSGLGTNTTGRARIEALNQYLYGELGFCGNDEHYNDTRNSFLNEVLERRTGIPISLAIVYIEVARRAGVLVDGINFPGHFLLRHRGPDDELSADRLVLDPFNRGVPLSESDCRDLLRQHVGDTMVFEEKLLAPATTRQILARMLMNLKRIYVRNRSFPQALAVTELLLALEPGSVTELRDRGLLAYHLGDLSRALTDLKRYVGLSSDAQGAPEAHADRQQILEHVKTLRRRVAELN